MLPFNKGPMKLLVVEDNRDELETTVELLERWGYEVVGASDGEEALNVLQQDDIDLVIADLVLPGSLDGIQLMEKTKKLFSSSRQKVPPEFILVTGHATVETAIDAMKKGAYDYLIKPIDLKRFRVLVEKGLEKRLLHTRLSEREGVREGFHGIVGQSKCMQDLYETIKMVAPTDSTVLILGESGTGKELVANALHQLSARCNGSCVKVNCSAIPSGLIESELFGHQRGAFTGAVKSSPGKFELASGGTFFLDEIGDLPMELQPKLLRVLEDKQVERVGGRNKIEVDIRFIAASNKDLEGMVNRGEFRSDLYYRLRVVTITIPPLRERKEDIPLLVGHFIRESSKNLNKDIKGIDPELLESFKLYNWPGNVRELKHAIEEMVVLARGEILTEPPSFLKSQFSEKGNANKIELNLSQLEQEAIEQALRIHDGDKRKAAETLGISLRTLYRKLKEIGNS